MISETVKNSMSIELYEKTRKYFVDLIDHFYIHGGNFNACVAEAEQAAERAGMTKSDMVETMLKRWADHVEDALSDGVLTETEEQNIDSIAIGLDTSAIELADHNTDEILSLKQKISDFVDQMDKLSRIRRLRAGKLNAESFKGVVPFKLQKGEVPIWQFDDVILREFVSKNSMKGRSLGASIRVAKGVYIRPSAFTASPHKTESLEHTDTGTVVLTSKHIAFDGNEKHFKIRLTSLANIKPYSDGLELQKNTQTARPFFLMPLDGWFLYNAIQAA